MRFVLSFFCVFTLIGFFDIAYAKDVKLIDVINNDNFDTMESVFSNLTVNELETELKELDLNKKPDIFLFLSSVFLKSDNSSELKNSTNFLDELFLNVAMYNKNPELIKILLRKGANINYRNEYGSTPLMYAVNNNDSLPVIKTLIDEGARVKDKDKRGKTVLMYSTRNKNIEIFKLLFELGGDLNNINKSGLTAFMFASIHGNFPVVKYLIKKGAKINQKASSGETPLMHALRNNNLDIARYLIEAGADVTARDNRGNTALIQLVKAEIDAPDIVKMLIERGVDIEAKSYFCNRAIDYATLCNLKNTEEILLKKGVKPTDYLCSCEELDDYWHGNSVCPYTPEQSPEEEKTFWQTIKEKVM